MTGIYTMESQTLLKIVREKYLMTEKYPNKLLSEKKIK